MDRLAICICTYKRPEGLSAVLRSLDAQHLVRLRDGQITVIVVDNSADNTALGICQTYRQKGRFILHPVHEPHKGLVRARNACLKEARSIGASHILFLDDDEAASPGWLEALHGRLASRDVAAAVGPVFPVFERPPPEWLPAHRYVNRVAEQGGFVEDGHTCNAIIKMSALADTGIAFNLRFNETGGEDTMFFRTLRSRGYRIAWVEEARVHETVPVHRMSLGWLFRRWYRTGNVAARLSENDDVPLSARLIAFAKGSARVSLGALRVLHALVFHAWRRPDRFIASFYTLCRGAGYLGAAFGSAYREYSRPAYR